MAVTINASTSTGLVQSADTSGQIELQTNGTTVATVNTSNNVQFRSAISVGNATPTTSGAGITFPATQSASSNANTLDDYEEGTWTPTYYGSSTAGTTTYTNQYGSYVKIGNSVYCECYMSWSAVTGTGDGLVGNFPFTVNAYSSDSRALFYIGAYNGYSITGTLTGVVQSSGTNLILYAVNNGSLGGSGIQSSGYLRFQFWYRSTN